MEISRKKLLIYIILTVLSSYGFVYVYRLLNEPVQDVDVNWVMGKSKSQIEKRYEKLEGDRFDDSNNKYGTYVVSYLVNYHENFFGEIVPKAQLWITFNEENIAICTDFIPGLPGG